MFVFVTAGPKQRGHDVHVSQDALGHPPPRHRPGAPAPGGRGREGGRERGDEAHGDVQGLAQPVAAGEEAVHPLLHLELYDLLSKNDSFFRFSAGR